MAEFIQTEGFNFAGERGELQVFEAVKAAFQGREALGWWRYPLITGKTVREPDILLIDPELGVIIIEVKSLHMSDINRVSGYSWKLNKPYFGDDSINPYEQAKAQLQVVMQALRGRVGLDRVPGRALVAVPFITRDDWENAAFDTLISDTPLLFGDCHTPRKLITTIERTALIAQGIPLDNQQWHALKRCFSTSGNLPTEKNPPTPPPISESMPTDAIPLRGELLQQVRIAEREFDLQQERIAKTIPPGPQRIRGLAGSGKTVLLAQKAAYMHLKHPNWDIALVFSTRSLYDQVTRQVDHWLKKGSNGEVRLSDAKHKLRILHAWGAKDQPGFYRVLAEHAGIKPLGVQQTPYGYQAGKNLIYCAKHLLQECEKNQTSLAFFDAVLIDEGQDLVNEDPQLLYQGRQAFYWLAYQSLRPIQESSLFETGTIPLRRLIWAYDEAQSLDSMMIPNTRTLFGDSWEDVFGAGVSYKGGIGKSEVMRVSYRTPRSVLVAAHALGMGLLREGGMISGPTRKEDWNRLGYDVEGSFTKGSVTLRRSIENSPHPLQKLSKSPLISFEDYDNLAAELRATAGYIKRDIQEGLQPSRHIMVVALGQLGTPKGLLSVGQALNSVGIDFYIPGTLSLNSQTGKEPNLFWKDGGVTITGIHRAKGNEADSVYVIGLDAVAANENDLTLRNQLFTAMSRSRAWLHLSGVGLRSTSFGKELEDMLQASRHDAFTFIPSIPKRRTDDEELGD